MRHTARLLCNVDQPSVGTAGEDRLQALVRRAEHHAVGAARQEEYRRGELRQLVQKVAVCCQLPEQALRRVFNR